MAAPSRAASAAGPAFLPATVSPAQDSRHALRASLVQGVCLLAIALPWLNPYASGPSASVVPWLTAWCAAAVLCLAAGVRRLPPALLAGCLVFTAWAMARGTGSIETFAVAGAMALVLMAAAAGASLAQRPDGVRTLVEAWVLAAALSAVMALGQHQGFAQDPFDFVSAASPGEAFGNLRQRNQFASLTALGLAGCAWLFARGTRVWVLLPLVVVLAAANAASTSRTGLLQLLLLAGFSMALPGPRRGARLGLSLAAVGAYALAAVGLPWLLELRGLGGGTLFDRVAGVGACSSRRVLWSNILDLIAQRPWLGWGWGELDYAHYAHLYGGPRFCDILDNAHNLPLHLAVELGLPAAALAMGAMAAALWHARPWRETSGDRRLAWAVLGAIALHSLVEYPLWYGPFQMAAGLSVGILCARAVPPVSAAASLARIVLPAAALAAAGYAAWDYWRVGQVYLPEASRAPAYSRDTLARIGHSWLFRDQVRFAALTTTPLRQDNAAQAHFAAQQLLHFSPEPRVIERAIDSALILGLQDEARLEAERFSAAFAADHARWRDRSAPAASKP